MCQLCSGSNGLATEKIGEKNDKDISIEERQEAQRRQKKLSSDPIFLQAIDQVLTPEVIKQIKKATSKEEFDRIYNSLTKQVKERAKQASAGVDVKAPQNKPEDLPPAGTGKGAESRPEVTQRQTSKEEDALPKTGTKEGSRLSKVGKGIINGAKNVILRPVCGIMGAAVGGLKGAYQGVRDGDGFIDSCAGLVSGAVKGIMQGARDGFCFDANGVISGNYASDPLRRRDYDKDMDRSSKDKGSSKNGTKLGLLIGMLILIALPGPVGLLALIACVVAGNRLGQKKQNEKEVVHVDKRPVRTSPSGEELERPREPSKEELESMVTTVREIDKDKQTKEEIQKAAEKLVEKAIENPEEFSKVFKEETEKLAKQIREKRAREAAEREEEKGAEKEDGKGSKEKAKEAAKEAVESSARLVGPVEEVSPERSAGPSLSPAPRGQEPETKGKGDNKQKSAGPHSARVRQENKDELGR